MALVSFNWFRPCDMLLSFGHIPCTLLKISIKKGEKDIFDGVYGLRICYSKVKPYSIDEVKTERCAFAIGIKI